MILNSEEIKNLKIIESFDEENFENASYNLSIDKIITMDGKEQKSGYKIKSQEILWAICKEKFNLPKDVIGLVHVKTTFTRDGIFAMNTGIIDPEYNGKISTLLINFGKKERFILKDEIILRVIFANINITNDDQYVPFKSNKDDSEYLNIIKKSTDNFDKTFLNMSMIQEKWYFVFKNKIKNFLLIFAAIAGCSFFIKDIVIPLFINIKTFLLK